MIIEPSTAEMDQDLLGSQYIHGDLIPLPLGVGEANAVPYEMGRTTRSTLLFTRHFPFGVQIFC